MKDNDLSDDELTDSSDVCEMKFKLNKFNDLCF